MGILNNEMDQSKINLLKKNAPLLKEYSFNNIEEVIIAVQSQNEIYWETVKFLIYQHLILFFHKQSNIVIDKSMKVHHKRFFQEKSVIT